MSALILSDYVVNHIFAAVRQANHLLSSEFLDKCNRAIEPTTPYRMQDIELELFELGRVFGKGRFEQPYTNMLQWAILLELVCHYQNGQNAHLIAFFNKYDKRFYHA